MVAQENTTKYTWHIPVHTPVQTGMNMRAKMYQEMFYPEIKTKNIHFISLILRIKIPLQTHHK